MAKNNNSKPHLTRNQREEIRISIANGLKVSFLAAKFMVRARTIKNIAKRPTAERKSYDNTNRFKLTEQNNVEMIKIVNENFSATNSAIKNQLALDVSPSTITRALKRNHIKSHIQRTATFLDDEKADYLSSESSSQIDFRSDSECEDTSICNLPNEQLAKKLKSNLPIESSETSILTAFTNNCELISKLEADDSIWNCGVHKQKFNRSEAVEHLIKNRDCKLNQTAATKL